MSTRAQYQTEAQDGDIVVDNSTMKEVLKCSTAAVLRYGLHLAPKVDGAAMLQGQAGHAAMAEWFDTGSQARALSVYETEYKAVVEPALAALPVGDKRGDLERARLEYGRTRQLIRGWMKERPLETWSLVVTPGETELAVSAPLMQLKDGRRVVFVALMDALARRRHGGRFSVDHKFRNGITDWWKDKQEDSSQFTGQMWLGRQWEMELGGVYVNAIEVPNAKTSDRKCSEHGTPYKECDLKHARHELIGPLTKSKIEIRAWQATLERVVVRWVKLRDRVKSLDDIASVPMEGRFNESCTFCGFRAWCRVGRPAGGRGDWFVEHTWNPLAERRSVTA